MFHEVVWSSIDSIDCRVSNRQQPYNMKTAIIKGTVIQNSMSTLLEQNNLKLIPTSLKNNDRV